MHVSTKRRSCGYNHGVSTKPYERLYKESKGTQCTRNGPRQAQQQAGIRQAPQTRRQSRAEQAEQSSRQAEGARGV